MGSTPIGWAWVFLPSRLFHVLKNRLSLLQRSFNFFLFQKKANNTPVKASHNVSNASVLMCILRKRPLVGVKSINSDSLGPKKTARDRLIEVIFTEIKANDFCHVDE